MPDAESDVNTDANTDESLVFCKRCREWKQPVASVPWGGQLGEEIRTHVCEDTWREWMNMEVMVINELRLNFMDPKSQDVLIGHMREFLCLDAEVEETPRP